MFDQFIKIEVIVPETKGTDTRAARHTLEFIPRADRPWNLDRARTIGRILTQVYYYIILFTMTMTVKLITKQTGIIINDIMSNGKSFIVTCVVTCLLLP